MNIDSTTTVVTACSGFSPCSSVKKVTFDGVTFLDFLVTEETYNQDWGVTFGFVGPRRVVYPVFQLNMRNPEDEEMTLKEYGKDIRLKRIP